MHNCGQTLYIQDQGNSTSRKPVTLLPNGVTLTAEHYLKPQNKHCSIIILDPTTGAEAAIERVPLGQSQKYLGTHMSPCLYKKFQINVTMTKAESLAAKICSLDLSPADVAKAYFSVYLPSITYLLGSNPITATACQKIDATVSAAFTLFRGYHITHLQASLYAPVMLLGAGFQQLECKQGILQLQLLLWHLWLQSPTGTLLCHNMEELQLLAGVSYPILEHTEQPLPYLPPVLWLCSLQAFLSKIQGSIVTTIKPTTIQQDNNCCIMEHFISNRVSQKPSRLQELSNCRLYLQVETLTNICNPDGIRFNPNMLWGCTSFLAQAAQKHGPNKCFHTS